MKNETNKSNQSSKQESKWSIVRRILPFLYLAFYFNDEVVPFDVGDCDKSCTDVKNQNGKFSQMYLDTKMKNSRSKISKILIVFILPFILGVLNVTSLIADPRIEETFLYPIGTNINNASGWYYSSSGYPIFINSPSLNFPGYPFADSGNAAVLDSTGNDAYHPFPSIGTTRSAYASCLVRIDSAQRPGDFFLALSSNSGYHGKVHARYKNGSLEFGITKSNASDSNSMTWAGGYQLGQTYYLVLKYKFNSGSFTNDQLSLFIYSADVPNYEPQSPTIGPLTFTTSTDANTIYRINLVQGSSQRAPRLAIDAIVIDTMWEYRRCIFPGCSTDTLNISTGFDHNVNTTYPTGSYDAFWELIETPVPGSNVPRASSVISPYYAWDTQSGSGWISAYPTNNFTVNNPDPLPFYTYQTCFCICENGTQVTLDINVLADDECDIYLDNTFIGFVGNGPQAFQLPPDHFLQVLTLSQGNHCLQIRARNTGAVAMGVNLLGTITGANLLNHACCSNGSKITGMKFNDMNQNGIKESNEPGIQGWIILLNNGSSTVTDAQGNYTFANLLPGSYTVSELLLPGWSQTYPPSGTYNIQFGASTVVGNIDFGNYRQPGCEPVCYTDTLNISTGFNHKTGSPYANHSYDGYWDLVESPLTGLKLPRPAATFNFPGWTMMQGSNWLNPLLLENAPEGGYANNPHPDTTYTFQTCFCVCQDSTPVAFDFRYLFDDSAWVCVDGVRIPYSGPGGGFINPQHYQFTQVLDAGEHCIQLKLRNLGGSPLGVNLNGFITGPNLIKQDCCDSTGSVIGLKFEDKNQNGIRDAGEGVLSNWKIKLTAGSSVQETTTDAYGFYVFNNLPTGVVGSVTEIYNPKVWSKKYPTGSGWNIFLTGSEVEGNLNFGNYNKLSFDGVAEGNFNLELAVCSLTVRHSNPPYEIAGTTACRLNTSGWWIPEFPDTLQFQGGSYYLVVKTPNTLETWSANPVNFANDVHYDFTTSLSMAYGNNMVMVGGKACFFSGDVNQDGTIDVSDIALINNDVMNFVTGDVVTDLNRDQVVDVSDVLLAYNNAANFVSLMTP